MLDLLSMGDLEPCEKHEIINCATCKEQAERAQRRKPATSDAGAAGRSFKRGDRFTGQVMAQMDGRCPACGEDIVADYDLITQDADGAWIHVECP